MKISDDERKEMLVLAASEDMRLDHVRLASVNAKTPYPDADAFIELLNFYNGFLNQPKRVPRLFVEKIMRL